MRSGLVLAPGIEFSSDLHEYRYEGKKLSGVTGLISKRMGYKMNNAFVEEHREEGIHIHSAVQRWIETGNPESVHSGVQWFINSFYTQYPHAKGNTYSEVLVSDFERYASAVDIVIKTEEGLVLLDLKKGSLNRPYVTLQLSIYKYLVEKHCGMEVSGLCCVSLRDKEYYTIFPKPEQDVVSLLYG